MLMVHIGRLSIHDRSIMSAMAKRTERPLVSSSVVLRQHPPRNCCRRHGIAAITRTTQR